MEIKFLDLKSQYLSIKDEIDAAIAGVIDITAFALGPAVKEFEQNFATYCQTKHCIGVDSGTSALHLILRALNIGPGDEIVTAANTFIATAAAIIHCGARPVLVDIDPQTRNIDLSQIEDAITERTKAIMPVHLYGSMVDMPALEKLIESNNIIIIEDAAQAQGAELNGQRAGSFGVAAGFSFYPGKNLGAYGEAGAIVTSDDTLAGKLRLLRDHGSGRKYYHDIIGYNARMHGLQGAVLNVKLKHLNDWNKERNRVAREYTERLADLPINLPQKNHERFDVYHQFVIETDRRDQLQAYLMENNVPTMIHYPIPIHRQKAYLDLYGVNDSFPVTEKLAGQILSLPIYPELSTAMVDFISERISSFFD